MSHNKSPIAAIFKSELQYMLEMHFALEDYYKISFAHNDFHAYKAYNIEELEATYYFNGLDPSLVGSFRIVIPMELLNMIFENYLKINILSILGLTPKTPHGKS